MIIESVICVLACARLGAIHSVIFGGFSAQEVAKRCRDCLPSLILSASCGFEPHKIVDYPLYLRDAKVLANMPHLPIIYVSRH